MKKEIAIFCVFVAFIVAIAGIMIHEAQLDIDRRDELKEDYKVLSVKYNETSKELDETNAWLKKNQITAYENLTRIGDICVQKGGNYADVGQWINNNRDMFRAKIGVDSNHKIYMETSIYNCSTKERITNWNCTGE